MKIRTRIQSNEYIEVFPSIRVPTYVIEGTSFKTFKISSQSPDQEAYVG